MIGIYNTIAFDGKKTGKANTLSVGASERAYFVAGTRTVIRELVIDGFYAYQSSTPSPTTRVAISGYSSATWYKASSASATGSSQSQSMGRTIYGGSYDVSQGKLISTRGIVRLTSTAQSWTSYGTAGSTRRYGAKIEGMAESGSTDGCLCTHAVKVNSYGSDWGTFYFGAGYVYFNDKSGNFVSLDDFKSWLDSHNTSSTYVQITYPLATPIVYNTGSVATLTPNIGNNYYYSNNGAVTLTYVEPYIVLKRPSDFAVEREDIYAGEYTTCTGAVKADRIGWKYADMTLTFDELTPEELNIISGLYGAVTFYFDDSDGAHAEQVIKTGFSNTPTRYTLPDGKAVWKNVGVSLRFIDAHN